MIDKDGKEVSGFSCLNGWLLNRLNGEGARLVGGKSAMDHIAITEFFQLFTGYLLAFCQHKTGIDQANFAETSPSTSAGQGR